MALSSIIWHLQYNLSMSYLMTVRITGQLCTCELWKSCAGFVKIPWLNMLIKIRTFTWENSMEKFWLIYYVCGIQFDKISLPMSTYMVQWNNWKKTCQEIHHNFHIICFIGNDSPKTVPSKVSRIWYSVCSSCIFCSMQIICQINWVWSYMRTLKCMQDR